MLTLLSYVRLRFVAAVVLLLLVAPEIQAQDAVSDSGRVIPYGEFFRRLEQRDTVRIYYRAEWFAGKLIHSPLGLLPAEKAIATAARMNQLDVLRIDSRSYVFLPPELRSQKAQQAGEAEVLLIGNPALYGKSSRAELTGTISSGATGETLPGVVIQVEKLKLAAVTDSRGNYNLSLPAGDHTLRINAIGFQDIVQKIRIVSAGNADFSLFEKSVMLGEVVILDKRADNNLTRAQTGSFRLDNKALKLIPATLGETDLIRSITSMPGIQSPGEFGAGFQVRGGSADQNLVLLEEVPLFNSSHLLGFTTSVNADIVSGVTLYKSGIPARYGERVASVMLIRTGTDDFRDKHVKGGIGLLNSRLTALIPFARKRGSLMLGGRTSYSDWLLHQVPDIDLKNSSAGFYDLNGMLSLNPGADDRITLFGYYSRDHFGFSRNTDYRYSNLLGSLRWTHSFGPRLSSSLLAGWSQYRMKIADTDTLDPTRASVTELQTLYRSLKLSFTWTPLPKHSFDFGLSGILYSSFPGTLKPVGALSVVQPVKMARENGMEAAVYVSDEFSLSRALSAEAGLRMVYYRAYGPGDVPVFEPGTAAGPSDIRDTLHYSAGETIWSTFTPEPRISIRWSLTEMSSVKLSYNRMNQFINLISNTSVISPTDIWKLSGKNLRPVSCDQLSAGYYRNFRQNTIETSLEFYVKDSRHVIEYRNGAVLFMNPFPETELLDARALGYGMELFVKKNSGKLTGWLSYTWSRSVHRSTGIYPETRINDNTAFPSNYDIPHSLNTGINYQMSRRWRFAATFTCNTGRPVTLPELRFTSGGTQLIYYSDRNKYRLPAYHRLDVSLTFDQNLKIHQKWKGSWTLTVINVYGRKNAFSVYYSREDPRTWNSGGSYNLYKMYIMGVPLPTLTYNFSF
jgi:hypothetical protein